MLKARLGLMWDGSEVVHDFCRNPHILIAGETGSGKSVMMHTIILTAVLPEADASMVLIDPKMVEFSMYRNNSHLWCPVARGTEESLRTLQAVLAEVQRRYAVMEKRGIRKTDAQPLYVFIDELADLMYSSRKETERLIARIAALGRACNVHLIVATQTPRAAVVSGMIKANLGTKIVLATASALDSRVIMDENGAEMLEGRGDAIYKNGLEKFRFQGYYVSDEQIEEYAWKTRRASWWEKIMIAFCGMKRFEEMRGM
jgi:S-DNA-T family DNA segregation ATPase FtsK/SpoIIIE